MWNAWPHVAVVTVRLCEQQPPSVAVSLHAHPDRYGRESELVQRGLADGQFSADMPVHVPYAGVKNPTPSSE